MRDLSTNYTSQGLPALPSEAVNTPKQSRMSKLRTAIKSKVKLIFHTKSTSTPPVLNARPFVVEQTKFISQQISENTLISYNTKTGEYTYITEAPPIKNLVISGGGAKGVALPGVFKAFEEPLQREQFSEENISLRDQLENVAGSSVGAIQGSLIAAGISADDLTEAMRNENFKALLGKGKSPINKCGTPLLDFVRKNIKDSIAKNLKTAFSVETLRDLGPEQINACVVNRGCCSSDEEAKELAEALGNIVNELNKENAGDVRITFSMLSALHDFDPKAFKHLTVTATCCQKGETFYFDAQNTPDLDIALAVRASASLPVILESVFIPAAQLGKYAEGAQNGFTFIDGGYLDNIPVAIVHDKQGASPPYIGEHGQNLQTLVLVFDDSDQKKVKQSPFLNVSNKKHTLYNSAKFKERLIRDVFARRLGKIKTKLRNTKTKEEGLEVIREQYSARCIPLRMDLDSGDFKRAKKLEEKFLEQGLKEGREYLEHRRDEAYAKHFTSLQDLQEYLPEDIKGLDSFKAFKNAIEKTPPSRLSNTN